ncbi:hypothetical protein OXX69_012997 [Metschnikowia pulcherrima]
MPTLFKITYAQNTFKPGPWNLGKFSRPIGFFSVAFVATMVPFLCFPTVSGSDLTPDAMNWTVVVFFGPMLIFVVWFVVDAHKWYTGPRPNIGEYISHESSDAVLIEGIKNQLSSFSNGVDSEEMPGKKE